MSAGELLSWKKRYEAAREDAAAAQEWEHGRAEGNLGRIFVIMLGVHVLVIGGAVLYHGIQGKLGIESSERHPQTSITDPAGNESPGAVAKPQDSAPKPAPEMQHHSAGSAPSQANAAPPPASLAKSGETHPTALSPEKLLDRHTKPPSPPEVANTATTTPAAPSLKQEPPVAESAESHEVAPKSINSSHPRAAKGSPSHVRIKAALSKNAAPAHSYKVKSQDTLYSIGRRFGVSVKALMKLNRLHDPKLLQTGAVLKIPQPHSGTKSTHHASGLSV